MKLLTVQEVAKELNKTPNGIRHMIEIGVFNSDKVIKPEVRQVRIWSSEVTRLRNKNQK